MNIAPRFRSRSAMLLTAGVAALALAGCSGTPSPDASAGTVTVTASAAPAAPAASADPSSSTPSAAASAPSSASTSASTSDSSGASTSGYRAARCPASALRGSIGSSEGAAGSTIVDLALQNTGSDACTLQGWPGVSFIDSAGKQIGAAADFDRASAHQTITLMPNAHAHASLKISNGLNYSKSECDPTTTTRLRVYPPGSTESIVVTTSKLTACSATSVHLLTVQALHATT